MSVVSPHMDNQEMLSDSKIGEIIAEIFGGADPDDVAIGKHICQAQIAHLAPIRAQEIQAAYKRGFHDSEVKYDDWLSPDEQNQALTDIVNETIKGCNKQKMAEIQAAKEEERKILGIELERLYRATNNRVTQAWCTSDFIKALKEGKDIRGVAE